MTEQDSQDVVGRASNTPHSRSQRSSRSSSLTPATTVHSRSSATKHKAFRRTYVACKSCRTRKVKCIIDNKPPCEKCAREHRECQFNTHKTGKKQRQPPLWTRSASRDPDTAIASCISPEDDASITRHHDALSQHSNTSNIPPSPVRNINTAYTTRSSQVSLTVPGPQHSSTGASVINGDPNFSVSPSQVPETNDQRRRRQSTILSDQIVRTVVSRSTDALDLLFDAARQADETEDPNNGDRESGPESGHTLKSHHDTQRTQTAHAYLSTSTRHEQNEYTMFNSPETVISVTTGASNLSFPADDVLDTWGKSRFVIQGWFTAQEAVTFVDLFFENMADLSPILPDFYRSHENHYRLICEEPMLCTTILMISSRYHTLPGVGGVSRGYHIHQRLWHHCEHLLQRVMLGQEKYSSAKTRTLGTIESFLLIAEWTPRMILFPPDADGWDSQLLSMDVEQKHRSLVKDMSAPARWQEDVFLPSKRSDYMSWMLVGAATSLAYELGVFLDTGLLNDHITSHRYRIRRLLFIYVNQIATRMGCASMLPQNISHLVSPVHALNPSNDEYNWSRFIDHWIDITKLMKTSLELLFPSATVTKQLLLDGRYATLLQHFEPSLRMWHDKFISIKDLPATMECVLFMEYHYVKSYMNSLAIQAVVERAIDRGIGRGVGDQDNPFFGFIEPHDFICINEVKNSSLQILQRGISLARSGSLKYTPMRIVLRIASASLFLLKSISLGGNNNDLQTSLRVLDESNAALRTNPVDDMDLAARYATLLERHTTRFRRNFMSARQPEYAFNYGGGMAVSDPSSLTADMNVDYNLTELYEQSLLNTNGWSIQPFDPSLAPFSVDGYQMFLGFDNNSLDFLWNTPIESENRAGLW